MVNIKTLAVGSVGATAVELGNYVQVPEIDPTGNSVSIIIQIVIGLATLFKMFKKPKGVK